MENKVFLNRHRLSLGWNGLPVELHRTPTSVMYRGQELESGREMAIELVPLPSPEAGAQEKFEAEADAAKQIKQISIPTLYDFGVQDGQLVYVTEYFDGHTAEAWVAARGPLPTSAALRVAVQVADALRAASFHHICHRTLCPANIVFVPHLAGEWPVIKVLHWLGLPTDFSKAAENDARLATAAHFASPEQLRGEEVDFSSATYSLGCTIWFLLTGAVPADFTVASEETSTAVPDVEKLRGVPKMVRQLLGRMLRANPAERPQDPVALLAFLQACLARVTRREGLNRRLGLPTGFRPLPLETGVHRRRPAMALVAAIILVCAGLAALAVPRYFHGKSTAQANPRDSSRVDREVGGSPATRLKSDQTRQNKPAQAVVAAPAGTALSQVRKLTGAPHAETGKVEITAVTNPSVSERSPGETVAARAKDSQPLETKKTPPEVPREAAPPEEGPSVVVASTAHISRNKLADETPRGPDESNSPDESTAGVSDALSDIPDDKPPAFPEGGAETAALAETAEPAAQEEDAAPRAAESISDEKKSPVRSADAKRTTQRKKSSASGKVARTRVRKANRVVRRAEKIPQIRIGSDKAELIGTTPDGKWILSVSSSGERVIVPPPPGYSR